MAKKIKWPRALWAEMTTSMELWWKEIERPQMLKSAVALEQTRPQRSQEPREKQASAQAGAAQPHIEINSQHLRSFERRIQRKAVHKQHSSTLEGSIS
jgi:hypothetical protein